MVKRTAREKRPSYFVSYSTREPHVWLFIECLRLVFDPYFDMKITPSDLPSGSSQLKAITNLISGCSFAVICLDGLRPNVVFEYGILHGRNIPTMLFKEAEAQVDIKGLLRESPELTIGSFPFDLDLQFSDVKDVHYVKWNRFEVSGTVKLIWDEYRKKKGEVKGYIEIPEPALCR